MDEMPSLKRSLWTPSSTPAVLRSELHASTMANSVGVEDAANMVS